MHHSEIKNQISTLEQDVNSLKGKLSLLNKQQEESVTKQKDLQHLQTVNVKSVELLHLVKKVTQEQIKQMFEKIVTEALRYIHQNNDYKFELIFNRRGGLPTLDFAVKTSGMQEAHDIIDSRGGGTCDIVSLALRFVLLEVSQMPGFIFFDEPEKHLDSPETLQKMIEFVKEMQKETNRQIFWITHKQEVVDSVINPIIISKSVKCLSNDEQLNKSDTKPKKRRGRPKKNVKKD